MKIANFVRSSCGLLVLVCAGVLAAAEPPTLSVNDVSVTEGNHGVVVAVFTVSLSEAAEEEVSVRYRTVDDSAKAGSDYVAASGVVAIPPGKTSAQIVVQVKSNMVEDPNKEFLIQISQSEDTTHVTARGTIVDDDGNGGAR